MQNGGEEDLVLRTQGLNFNGLGVQYNISVNWEEITAMGQKLYIIYTGNAKTMYIN